MHGTRNPSARRGEDPCRWKLDPGRQVEARYLRYGLVPESTQSERPLGPSRKGRRWLVARVQDDEQQRPAPARTTDRGDAIEQVAAGVVRVVDDK